MGGYGLSACEKWAGRLMKLYNLVKMFVHFFFFTGMQCVRVSSGEVGETQVQILHLPVFQLCKLRTGPVSAN